MYNLKDRKVLVTGASRGLGAGIAKAFAEEGCDLAITYLGSKDKAEAVAAGIRTSTGRRVVILQAVSTVVDNHDESNLRASLADTNISKDLSLVPECQRTVEWAVRSLGGLDIVVHNAVCLRTSVRC
jgi:NAD(P)-dependent dehydrogenase (short-subunit alcohol dehydrogenase family)